MNTELFLSQLEKLSKLPDHVVSDLQMLVPSLTDAQRADLFPKMAELNKGFAHNKEEAEKLEDEAGKLTRKIQHEFVPRLRSLEESGEKADDMKHAEDLLSQAA